MRRYRNPASIVMEAPVKTKAKITTSRKPKAPAAAVQAAVDAVLISVPQYTLTVYGAGGVALESYTYGSRRSAVIDAKRLMILCRNALEAQHAGVLHKPYKVTRLTASDLSDMVMHTTLHHLIPSKSKFATLKERGVKPTLWRRHYAKTAEAGEFGYVVAAGTQYERRAVITDGGHASGHVSRRLNPKPSKAALAARAKRAWTKLVEGPMDGAKHQANLRAYEKAQKALERKHAGK